MRYQCCIRKHLSRMLKSAAPENRSVWTSLLTLIIFASFCSSGFGQTCDPIFRQGVFNRIQVFLRHPCEVVLGTNAYCWRKSFSWCLRASQLFVLLCAGLLTSRQTALSQTVTSSSSTLTKAMWVASSDYNLHNNKDYKTTVLAAGLNAFYKTYPNATPAQAQDLVTALNNKLAGIRIPTYVIGHQTEADVTKSVFDLLDDADLKGPAKLSLSVAKQGVEALEREQNALLDQQAQTAAANGLASGFQLASNSAYLDQQLESLYDFAKADPSKGAIIDGSVSPQLGAPTTASVDAILHANPSFSQFQAVQYIQQHMLTAGQFQDGLTNLRSEFATGLSTLNSAIANQVLPQLQSLNQTELATYATLQAYVADQTERQRQQQLAQQQQQARQLQLQAEQSGVYLLSTLAGQFSPQLGRTLNAVGNTAIQLNQALTNFQVAASSVDTSSIDGLFTGEQLGSVVLMGSYVGAAMQLVSMFQNDPSPDQLILQQISQLQQQITQLQNVMVARFDRIDDALASISGAINAILTQIGQVGADVKSLQNQLFDLQSQVNRLEVEVHEWLNNSDRIPLKAAINFALGYQQRTGQPLSPGDFQTYENLFYTWATSVVKDTTRAGPDYSANIVMANQLTFPLSSNVNYLAQSVSGFLGLPLIAARGTRLASPTDWLYSAGAYYELLKKNPEQAKQLPGSVSRIADVNGTGKQLRATLKALSDKSLFMDETKGLIALYKQKRSALGTAIVNYQHQTFLPANSCLPSTFDGNCLPPTVSLWDDGSSSTYRPSISGINGCDGQHNLNLSIPGNDIFYAVPGPLLRADQSGHKLSLCLEPVIQNNVLYLKLHVQLSGQDAIIMTVFIAGVSQFLTDPWYDVYNELAWSWVGSGIGNSPRQQFEDHSKITLTVLPWAQQIYQTVSNVRDLFYKNTAQQFTAAGATASAAVDLNTAKTLLIDYLELGLPQTVRDNDYLRSLMYGKQALYGGYDPTSHVDIQSLYAAEGSTIPELPQLDFTPVTDQRLDAVASVLSQIFGQISASNFDDINPQIDRLVRRLEDYGYTLNQAQCATLSLSPPNITFGNGISTGGVSGTFSVVATNTCSWTAATSSLDVSITSAPSGSGAKSVMFYMQPNSGATRIATIWVGNVDFTVTQVGSGLGGGSLVFSPATLNFGNQPTGTVSAPLTLTVSNTGGAAQSIGSLAMTGANASEFNANTTCVSSLAAGAQCSISITFSPGAVGSRSASLAMSDASSNVITPAAMLMGTAATPPQKVHFVPLAPCRIADTRNRVGPFGGPAIAAQSSRDFDLAQSVCGIPGNAVAYALNVTVVPSTQLRWLTVWPAGETKPTASTLNSYDGRIKAEAAIMAAGANGAVSVFATDDTHVILDINGYFVADTSDSQLSFYPLTPCRVTDTRESDPLFGGPTLHASEEREIAMLSSKCNIPAVARAYSINFTVVPRLKLGYLTVWPSGGQRPLVSTLNSPTGTAVANAAIIPAGQGGDISVYVTDESELIMDINGYFAPPTPGGLSLYPLAPCRVLDSRQDPAGELQGARSIARGSTCGIPSNVGAIVYNATVVPSGPLSYLSLWPDNQAQPIVSTLNAYDSNVASNLAIVPTATGSINAFTAGNTQLLLDVSGYFAP